MGRNIVYDDDGCGGARNGSSSSGGGEDVMHSAIMLHLILVMATHRIGRAVSSSRIWKKKQK